MGKRIKEVTQITSNTTAVDVDGYDGIITTVLLTDDKNTSFIFTVNNPKARAVSTILLTPIYAGDSILSVSLVSQTKESFVVRIANVGVLNFSNVEAKIQFKVTHN
jgi:hypothetical protein